MIRKIARPMLASAFVLDGTDMLRNTSDHVEDTESAIKTLRKVVPAAYASYIPADPELVTRGLAGTKIAAAGLFGLGKAPRLSAAALALTQLPSLIGRNAFWKAEDDKAKSTKRNGFLTDTALLGALAILTQDTEGKPSLGWRARKGAKNANKKLQAALPGKSEQEEFAENVSQRASDFTHQAQDWFSDATDKAQAYVEDNRDDWEATGRGLLNSAKSYVADARDAVGDFIDDNRDDWEKQGRNFLDNARETAQSGTKTARKALADGASKAQGRGQEVADKAADAAGSFDARKVRKAALKKAQKLQKRADKAYRKAYKKATKAAQQVADK